jgi:hypothetical protein
LPFVLAPASMVAVDFLNRLAMTSLQSPLS